MRRTIFILISKIKKSNEADHHPNSMFALLIEGDLPMASSGAIPQAATVMENKGPA
jgi:hypothetical protein